MADETQFDEFVVARSQALVRSAYLLTQDEGLAEDLVQTALTKAWFAWRRIDDPEAYVRRIMVPTSASWWRRRWTREAPTEQPPQRPDPAGTELAVAEGQDLWNAIGHLPRRQRAVVVLRYLDLGLDDHSHLIRPEDRVNLAMGIQ
ncbi:SigE family RNA polymerase sigma factor [Nocardioides sp. W7]|uniref:SigE family RNA polymerase sigma factor n=1 Tax=Nocardioides sp. W7 TaxID=2931390 RepID=UPI001FD4E53B|nr:SigE family RNA polymerase sigma factor [Nocardioides sp. W7]